MCDLFSFFYNFFYSQVHNSAPQEGNQYLNYLAEITRQYTQNNTHKQYTQTIHTNIWHLTDTKATNNFLIINVNCNPVIRKSNILMFINKKAEYSTKMTTLLRR